MNLAFPKISAIITTYNSEASVERVIQSIKAQKGINKQFTIEIIVVDDCSTDSTEKVIRSHNLDYFSTEKNSGGPNKGRNIGLKRATGDFICLVDHDDEWHQNKIISILSYVEKTKIITSGYIVLDTLTNKKVNKLNISSEKKTVLYYATNETFLNKLKRSLHGQNTYLGSIVYSAQFKDILFEETYGMADYDWLLRLFYNQDSIEVCETLYTRYVSGTNLSLNEQYRLNDYNYSLKAVQDYSEKFPKEVKTSTKKINGSLARYYYLMGNMRKARHYFLKSGFNLKTFFYLFTSFVGSTFVKKTFNVFG